MSTSLDLSTEALEALDFPIPCAHSAHEGSPNHGDGPAEFIAKVTHDCPDRPGCLGTMYPACGQWARIVEAHYDLTWLCPICRQVSRGADMVIILGPLDTM